MPCTKHSKLPTTIFISDAGNSFSATLSIDFFSPLAIPFFFYSITLVLLVCSFFQRFTRNGCFSIVSSPLLLSSLLSHHHGVVGFFLSLHLQQLKMEQPAKKGNECMGVSWSEMRLSFARNTKRTNVESVIESMRDKQEIIRELCFLIQTCFPFSIHLVVVGV
jgi:hypothetical protein